MFLEQYLWVYSKVYYYDDIIDWINLFEFVYNNTINESTNEAPFFINYGFHPSMDANLYLKM